MSRKRVFRIILVGAVVLVAVAVGMTAYLSYSVYFHPLPQTSGTNKVEGLRDTVSVYRGSWAIPHISATNAHDLFFTQGYVHAQDRWWQMETSRYLGMGRLHEILTMQETVLQADRLMLTLGWADAAQSEWESLPADTKAILEAYSAGVNAYISERSAEDLASAYGLISLSGEYDNFLAYLGRDVEVEPWQPFHTLLLMKVFAWSLDANMWNELERAVLYGRLSHDMVTDYMVSYPYDVRPTVLSLEDIGLEDEALPTFKEISIVPDGVVFDETIAVLQSWSDATPELMAMLGFRSEIGGNAWVVSGNHTQTGQPLLANDLQLPIEIPAPWFEMGLRCGTVEPDCMYTVTGFSLPGVPGILVGHNNQIAWGLSPTRVDVQDLYLLRLNPDNLLQYEVDGQWESMEQRSVLMPVDGEVLEVKSYYTRYGPVITDIEQVRADPRILQADYQALALHWGAATYQGDVIGTILDLNLAQNWDEFHNALEGWLWPTQGFVYADVEGNIGYQMAGAVPIRHVDHSGLVPAPGWDSSYEWVGFVPYKWLPSVYNPDDGVIVDANNPVVPLEYYGWLEQRLGMEDINVVFSQEWAFGYRAQRIETMLASVQRHSPDSFALIQGDNHSLLAEDLLPALFALEFDDPKLTEAVEWMKTWDLQTHMDSPQAALFAVWWSEVVRLTFADQLRYQSDGSVSDMWALTLLLEEPEHVWWDSTDTRYTRETRDDILRLAFVDAFDILVELLGEDYTEWRWGELHQGRFVSRIIGQEGFLSNNPAVNSGPFPLNQGAFEISGGSGSVNATTYTVAHDGPDEPFSAITVPSYRLIVDLDDFNHSRAMLTTGQSGHPASDNYKDMIVPWRTVEYHDLRWDVIEIRELSSRRLDLRPR